MLTENGYNGFFAGRALFQARGDTGGAKHVFVKIQGEKNELVFPTFGGRVMNPFKGAAKLFAGDLMEYRTDEKGLNPTIYLLKVYKVKNASGTSVKLYRDRYTHIPFVGDILMIAPAKIGGTGTAVTVTAVSKGSDGGNDTWNLTVDSALEASDGDVLVEADKTGAEAKMLVQNINAFAPCDYDFLYTPSAASNDDDEFDKVRYLLTPAIGGAVMYKEQMSPIPDCCEVFNQANVNGWFSVSYRFPVALKG